MKNTLKNNLYKLGIVSVAATTLATVSTAATTGVVSANENTTNTSQQTSQQTSGSQNSLSTFSGHGYNFSNDNNYNAFVQKFNNAVSLTQDGKYEINYSALPSNTSKDEVKELENDVNIQNANIEQSKMQNNVSVQKSADSINVMANGQSSSNSSSRAFFHKGKTYTRYYWWGQRVHISRNDIRKIGNYVAGGAVLGQGVAGLADMGIVSLPEGLSLGAISDVAAALGFGLSNFPGGMVFNHSATVGYWSAGFQ